ncbi:MAG TPA: DUF192 domain-containing protein, partial [Pseudomonas sp.]|nr:DUF192 domain-containing protein [Pseudomonas sp.]
MRVALSLSLLLFVGSAQAQEPLRLRIQGHELHA